jgi:hypothetical protein
MRGSFGGGYVKVFAKYAERSYRALLVVFAQQAF